MRGWKILCGGLVFVAVSTVAAAGLGTLAGKITVQGAWLSLGLGAVGAVLAARGAAAPWQKITAADTVLAAVFALASLRAFLWVLYWQGEELKVLSPHNLGDMALHLNIILRWANGGAFWPDNPFLAGSGFAYHPGADLWNALLRIVGVPVVEGLRWAGLLGAAATAAALWRWGRGFAMAGFLFAGGLGALAFFQTGQTDGMMSDIAWKNLFLAMLVTQRGLLYAVPAGLVLMTVWRARLDGDAAGPQMPVLAEVALYAGMPIFSAPAFLFLSATLAACALAGWRSGLSRQFVVVGLVSVIPATWIVRMTTMAYAAPSSFRFAPGWMQESGGLWFWLENFGIFLPLVIVLGARIFTARPPAGRSERTFYVLGAGTLVFCFLFLIAPWAWDNTKLMIWGYLALLPLLWSQLIGRWPEWARVAACIVLFLSGALSLVGGLDARHGYKLADLGEFSDVQVMLRGIPVNARVACAPGYNHPAMLLGQPLAMGYDGHLFSHGYDYRPVEGQLDRLMSGGEDWRNAARKLGVHYLFWGKREAAKWPASAQPWKKCAKLLASSPAGDLYLLTPCLMED